MKMKTINYFSIAFAGLIMFCSCNMAEMETISPETDGNAPALVAGEGQIVGKTPQMTKTALGSLADDGTYPVVWLDQDQIKVYGESNTDGVIYTASVSESEAATTAIFSAPSLDESITDDTRYAVYPAALAGAMTAEGITVDLTKLRRQEYHSSIRYFGTFENYPLPKDEAGNVKEEFEGMTQKEYYESATVFPHLPLWAKAEEGSSQFTFQNLMGVVKLAMNDYQGEGLKIKEVKMTAKTPISGIMTVDADGNVLVTGDGVEANTITIFSENGASITSKIPGLQSEGSAFLFFIPIGTYEGFDFEITTTDGRIFRKNTQTVVEVKPGIVKKFPVLNFTLFYGKANCYLVPAGETVEVDITPRYSFDMTFNGAPVEYVDGAEPTFKANVEWDIQRGGTNLNGAVIKTDASDVTISGNIMSIKTNYQGSALVSIRKEVPAEDNPILWSYHIWTVTKDSDHYVEDLTYVVGGETFQMMSHVLGATRGRVENATTAYETFGMYYQWGRKEPLPAYGQAGKMVDGVYQNPGVTALFSSQVDPNTSICTAIRNPLVAYKTQSPPSTQGVVFAQTKRNNVLWGAPEDYQITSKDAIKTKASGFVKTVYDPCPEGYMVPQGWHFSGLTVSSNGERKGFGAILKYDGVNECYYALPGRFVVTDDVVSGSTKTTTNGSGGRYHVSNPYGTGAWASSYFNPSFNSTVTLPFNYGAEANVCSVRCLKMPTQE